jgi:hypothetical protein
MGKDRCMPAADDVRAQLSSLSTMLDEVTKRLAAIAEAGADEEHPLTAELFEIERDLQSANRRLAKLLAQ